jgi:dipeptidyl aminopeptidase/acylaminoacyl peptidase
VASSSDAPSPTILPFGSWPTPVTSELIVRAAASLSGAQVDGDEVWWAELRPEEGGRTQIVRREANGTTTDVLPAGWNARTAVHEYGGGAWWVRAGTLWFVSWADQRLYRLDPGGQPVPVTHEPPVPRGERWADGDVAPDGRSILCVREHHPAGGGPVDVVNEVVRFVLDPSGVVSEPEVVVSGPDFVSDPRWRADGAAWCWLEWDHPNMPWDGTRLMVREGDAPAILVSGGQDESVSQPRWNDDGSLWFISDRSGWWNLYRWTRAGGIEPMVVTEVEIGLPQWVFGESRYDFLPEGSVAFAYSRDGFDRLAIRSADGQVTDLAVPSTSIDSVVGQGSAVVFIGASPTSEPAVIKVDVEGSRVRELAVLRPHRDLGLPTGLVSLPEPIEFPTGDGADGATAFALFYPPTNPMFVGPGGELPPLLVMIHGGPTGNAIPALRLSVQYWTSRGFAVVDVNYRGSTGFGRAYRNLLRDAWGVADVEDCEAAARWLAEQGRADPERLCIRGGSAGGFTTLAALATGDTFAAGASHYGVADLEALALETHKFESRYLDRLVGPYPERRDRYVERSPIHQLDGFDRPLIVLQGQDDEVVPPAQSEMIVAALRDRHVPVAYVSFEGEQHGFRQAANIRRALDSELSFYGQILGFELPAAEGIAAVEIDRG